MNFQDIHLEDKELWMQFLEYYRKGNYSSALNLLQNEQLTPKGLTAENLNKLTDFIVQVEGLSDSSFKSNRIPCQLEQPSGQSSGEIWFRIDEPYPAVLNDCPWSRIRQASDDGIADLIWSVGDRKAVSLTEWGATGSYAVSAGTYYCYILGFNHNSAIEGGNRIHFEFGFDSLSGGNHIAFCGTDFGLAWSNTNPYYIRMNSTATNSGGWKNSLMRTGTLNGSNRSFLNAIPADLKSVLKPVVKYTDNVGGGSGSVQSNVTATTDTIFILNVNEIRGTGTANTYEANYTKQYDYYKNGNAQNRAKSNDTATLCNFLTRSPSPSDARFMGLSPSASGVYLTANTVFAVSPAFCV